MSPKEDFFRFSNGQWCDNNPVPDTESKWGSFNELQDRNNKMLREILDEASQGSAATGSTEQLIGDYYYTFMDQEKRDADGLTPIQPLLDEISAVTTPEELMPVIAHHHDIAIESFFSIGVMQDLGDNTRHITYTGQGGISLGSKDYYVDEKQADLRGQYQEHVQAIFQLMGNAPEVAAIQAETV